MFVNNSQKKSDAVTVNDIRNLFGFVLEVLVLYGSTQFFVKKFRKLCVECLESLSKEHGIPLKETPFLLSTIELGPEAKSSFFILKRWLQEQSWEYSEVVFQEWIHLKRIALLKKLKT